MGRLLCKAFVLLLAFSCGIAMPYARMHQVKPSRRLSQPASISSAQVISLEPLQAESAGLPDFRTHPEDCRQPSVCAAVHDLQPIRFSSGWRWSCAIRPPPPARRIV